MLKDMFRFWRRSEGFKWVTYVPTRILERRNRRREQVQAMKIEVKSYWRHVTEALWRHLVTALAAARTWVVWAVISAATAAIAGARRIGAWLGPRLASQFEQFTARLAPAWHSLQRPPVALGLAIAGCGLALAGLFVGWHTKFDASVIGMILLGTLIAGVFGTPLIARRIGPPLAQAALRLLRSHGEPGARPAWLRASPAVLASLGVLTAATAGLWLILDRKPALPPVAGKASVVSAEVIRLDGEEVRLMGITAPDPEQRCGEGARRWNCASDSLRALTSLVRGKSLTCQLRGTDEAGRRLGQCFDGTLDINAELVRLGAAWADKSDSGGYRALEAKARDAKAGVWRGPSEPPWAWKEKLWTEAKHKAPDGCPIKGLIAGREKTYHMPWSPEYDRIKISQTSRSRRWFCSEAQAIEAGYKAQRGS